MERMVFDYAKLKGRIIEKCGAQKVFAQRLAVSEQTLTAKLKCESYFTQNEILKAADILEIRPDLISMYFFTKTVQ